jgi:hypothetical protein
MVAPDGSAEGQFPSPDAFEIASPEGTVKGPKALNQRRFVRVDLA